MQQKTWGYNDRGMDGVREEGRDQQIDGQTNTWKDGHNHLSVKKINGRHCRCWAGAGQGRAGQG